MSLACSFLFGNMEESMLNEVETEDSDTSVIASTAGVRPTVDFSQEKLKKYATDVFQAFFNESFFYLTTRVSTIHSRASIRVYGTIPPECTELSVAIPKKQFFVSF